jgi:hypothetical protein
MNVQSVQPKKYVKAKPGNKRRKSRVSGNAGAGTTPGNGERTVEPRNEGGHPHVLPPMNVFVGEVADSGANHGLDARPYDHDTFLRSA